MGLILGIIIGCITLVPGFSVIQGVSLGSKVGADNIIVIFCSHIISSIKECNYSAGSNNYQLDAAPNQSNIDLNTVLVAKIVTCCSGIALGIALGYLLPTTTGSIIFSLVIGSLIIYSSPSPVQSAMYVISCGIFFYACTFLTTELVLVGGACILGIPATIKAIVQEKVELENNENLYSNPIVLSIGSLVALFTPGVSSNAILSAIGSNNKMTALMTDIFIDSLALGLLTTNVESGKSIITMSSSYADIGTIVVVLIAIALSFVITNIVNPFYVQIFPEELFLVLSLIVNLIILFLTIGLWAAPLVLIGYIINSISNKDSRGLIFLAPILFL